MTFSLISAARRSLALATSTLVLSSVAAHAGTINVVNGGFEQTTLTKNSEFGTEYAGQAVAGWTAYGYTVLYMSGTSDSVGADTAGKKNDTILAGPANGHQNGLTASSPDGGNFVAMDANYKTGSISQTLSGFSAGDLVSVTFYYAASQQLNYSGANTEGLQVSLGGQTLNTAALTIPQQGFSGWNKTTLNFTATSGSELLSFLATSTPNGAPPFVLLDGVSATSMTPTPEPSSIALLGTGLASAAGLLRKKLKR